MTGKDMRILIVAEDTQTLTDLVQQVMKLEADSTLVDTLDDARFLIESDEFDVVIAERQLPDGSGLELLQFAERSGLPFILLGGQMDAGDILTAMRLGAADVIPSPIDYEHLLSAISKVVRQKREGEQKAYRSERLRRLSSRLIRERRELRKRVDLICNDLVVAYRELAEKFVADPRRISVDSAEEI